MATIINFALSPQALTFLGFTAATFVFDVSLGLAGYKRLFRNPIHLTTVAISISTLSAAVAGFIIGSFLMAGPALQKWGGALGWAALHAVGGIIGGGIGASLVLALMSRKILESRKQDMKKTQILKTTPS